MASDNRDILTTSIEAIPGVTELRKRAFAELGVRTVADLLGHFPFRIEAEHGENSIESHIAVLSAKPDAEQSANIAIRGTIAASKTAFGRRPRIEATLEDGTGTARLVFFNMPWMRGKLHPGRQGIVEGKAKLERGYLEVVNPKWSDVAEGAVVQARSDRMRAVYPSSEALPSRRHSDECSPTHAPQLWNYFLRNTSQAADCEDFRMRIAGCTRRSMIPIFPRRERDLPTTNC